MPENDQYTSFGDSKGVGRPDTISEVAQSTSISIYNNGLAVVQEYRVVTLTAEQALIEFRNIPNAALYVSVNAVDTENLTVLSQIRKEDQELFQTVFTPQNHQLVSGRKLSENDNETTIYLEDKSISIVKATHHTEYQLDNTSDSKKNTYSLDVSVKTKLPNAEYQFVIVYFDEDLAWQASYVAWINFSENQYHFIGKYKIWSEREYENAQVTLLSVPNSIVHPKTKAKLSNTNKHFYKRSGSGGYRKKKNSESNITSILLNKRVKSMDYSDTTNSYSTDLLEHEQFSLKESIVDIYKHENVYSFASCVSKPINIHFLMKFSNPPYAATSYPNKTDTTYYPEGESFEMLEILNNQESGLGKLLPPGALQVIYSRPATDGESNDLGIEYEASGKHVLMTKENETIQIVLSGQQDSFSGKKQRDKFTLVEAKKTITEIITLSITNNSKDFVTLVVEDNLSRCENWKVTNTSHEFHCNGKDKIRWILTNFGYNQTENITYTCVYTWD